MPIPDHKRRECRLLHPQALALAGNTDIRQGRPHTMASAQADRDSRLWWWVPNDSLGDMACLRCFVPLPAVPQRHLETLLPTLPQQQWRQLLQVVFLDGQYSFKKVW